VRRKNVVKQGDSTEGFIQRPWRADKWRSLERAATCAPRQEQEGEVHVTTHECYVLLASPFPSSPSATSRFVRPAARPGEPSLSQNSSSAARDGFALFRNRSPSRMPTKVLQRRLHATEKGGSVVLPQHSPAAANLPPRRKDREENNQQARDSWMEVPRACPWRCSNAPAGQH